MKSLERIYLMNIIFQLETIDDLISFIQVSKNCSEAFHMMHVNPYYGFKSEQKELKIFKKCYSLQTVRGHLEFIKDFQCNLDVLYTAEPQYGKNGEYLGYFTNDLMSCALRITKLKIFLNSFDLEIHWTSFGILRELTLNFCFDNTFHLINNLGLFFIQKLHFKELKECCSLNRICVRSSTLYMSKFDIGVLLKFAEIVGVASKRTKLYLDGIAITSKSPNENVIIISNSLTPNPETITNMNSVLKVDHKILSYFIRDWYKYFPMNVLLYEMKELCDISMVNSLLEVTIGVCEPICCVKLPKSVKKVTIIGSPHSIDTSLCDNLELVVEHFHFLIEPTNNYIKKITINCPSLTVSYLEILKNFQSLHALILNDYDDSIRFPHLPNVEIIKKYREEKVFYNKQMKQHSGCVFL